MFKDTFRFKTILSRLMFFNILLILIASILPQMILFSYFSSQYKQKLAQSNYENTMQVRDFVDESIFERLVSIPVTHFSDITSNDILIHPINHDIRGQSYKVLEVSKKVYEIQESYHFVANLNLYYSVNDLLFRGSHVFFLKPSSRENLNPMWLREVIESTENLVWEPVDEVETAFIYERSIPYFGPLPQNRAMLAIEVGRNEIVQTIEKTRSTKDGFFGIITETGEMVIGMQQTSTDSPNDEVIRKINALSADKDGFFKCKISGNEFLISYAGSRYNTWKYVSMIPTDHVFAGMEGMRLWLATLSIGFTCVNLAITVWVTKKAHSPMESIMNNIKSYVEVGQSFEMESNQYQMLDRTFHSLAFQVRDLNEHLEANQPIIYHNMIRRILTAQDQHIYRDAEIIHFKKPLFCCFILQMFHFGEGNVHNKMLVNYSITDSLNLRDTWYDVYSITDENDCIYGILNFTDENRLNAAVDEICDCLQNNALIPFGICIGRIVHREEDISISYLEALEVKKYLFFYSGNPRLYYGELKPDNFKVSGNVEKSLEKVRSAVAGEEWGELKKTVASIINLVSNQPYTADYRMNTLADLVSVIRKTAIQAGYDEITIFGSDIRKQMKTICHVDEFREWLDQMLDSLTQAASERKVETTVDLKKIIETYVTENIFQDLSLAGMSEDLCISVSHLSRIFKSVMGMNCSEYLVRAKLKKAQELLTETEYTVKEIAEKLGYSSTAHFIRIFKEQFGMTPKQMQMKMKGLI